MANQPKRDDSPDKDEQPVAESESDDVDGRDEDEDDDDDEDEDEEPAPAAKKAAAPAPSRGKKSAAPAKQRAVVDDEDEDEEDEDEDEDEPPPPKKSVSKKAQSKQALSARSVAVTAPRRRARPAPQLPDEDVIDAPKKQTLWMLGALALAIVTMWSASRFACNAHPMQTRKPREIATSELAKDPKGAALELAQRWAGYDFAGALELAKGPLAAELAKAKQQCDQDKAGCEKKREELKDQVLATAVLVSREGDRARARVSTEGGATGKETYVLMLEREGNGWKASSKGPDTGAPAPAPSPSPSAPPAASH
jgi:hypothetical protein